MTHFIRRTSEEEIIAHLENLGINGIGYETSGKTIVYYIHNGKKEKNE